MSKKFMFYLLSIILTFFCVDPAFATNLFTPTPGDKSMEFLNALFPGALGGGGADALADLFNVINSGALVVGGIFAAYTIIAGTIGTAHEGEMLGKKFSSIWVPIRTVVGTAGVVPGASGYSMIQVLVMWLVVQGIGFADMAWSKITTTTNIGNITNIKVAIGVPPNGRDFINQLLLATTCMRGLEKEVGELPGDKKFGWTQKTYKEGNVKFLIGATKKFENYDLDECGSATSVKFVPYIDDSAFSSSTLATTGADSKAFAATFNSASIAALNSALTETDNLAQTIVAGGTINYSQLESVYKNYQNAINNAAKNAISTSDPIANLSSNMQADGWISAGSFYSKLSKIQSNMNNLTSDMPTAKATVYTEDPTNLENYQTVMQDVQSKYVSKVLELINTSDNLGGLGIERQEKAQKDSSNFLYRLFSKIFDNDSWKFRPDPDDHPIVTLSHWGGGLLTGAVGFLGGSLFAAKIDGGMAQVASTLLLLPFSMLLGTAFAMLYVTPMIPFFIWFGAVIGWFTMVLEAMVAAPLWFVNHLNPYGSDLTGSAANGYRLVLGLVLRPALMVCGIWLSMLMLIAISPYFNKMFFATFNVTNGTGLAGFIGLIAAPFMYLTVMTVMMKKLFDLIHIIPDQILTWIGGGGAQLGGFAGSIGKGAEDAGQKAANVLSMAGQAANSVASSRYQNAVEGQKAKADTLSTMGFLDDNAKENMLQSDLNKNNVASAEAKSNIKGYKESLDKVGKAHFNGKLNDFYNNPDNKNSSIADLNKATKQFFQEALSVQASGSGGVNDTSNSIKGQMGDSIPFAQSVGEEYKGVADFAEKNNMDIPATIGNIANNTNRSLAGSESIQSLGSDVSAGIKGGDYSVMGNQQYAQLGGGDVEAGKKAFNGLVLGTLQNQISNFKNNASVK